MKNLLLTFILLFSFSINAQYAVMSAVDLNDPLPGATVVVEGTSNGVTSDFDGKYTFELSAGTYTLFSLLLVMKQKRLPAYSVTKDNYTTTDIVLNSAAQGLDEVIVSVEAKRNTESSVLEFKENQQVCWTEYLLKPSKKLVQVILLQRLKVSLEFQFRVENMYM